MSNESALHDTVYAKLLAERAQVEMKIGHLQTRLGDISEAIEHVETLKTYTLRNGLNGTERKVHVSVTRAPRAEKRRLAKANGKAHHASNGTEAPRVRDGYGVDVRTGYIRHSVLRAGVEALRRLGKGATIDEIYAEALKHGATFTREQLRTSVHRNPEQKTAAAFYTERVEGRDVYYLWEWRPGTEGGKAAIKRLHLEKGPDGKYYAPRFDTLGNYLGSGVPVLVKSKPTAEVVEPAKREQASVGDNGPYLDPNLSEAALWPLLSQTQQDYVVNCAKLNKPRVSALRFAQDPVWAGKVHRGEIKAEDE